MDVAYGGEASSRQPRLKLRAEVVEEVSRHVVDVRSLIDGDGLETRRVEGGAPGAAAFGRAAEAVGLQLAWHRPLAVEIHRVERRRRMKRVPPEAVQAAELPLHGRVAVRERGEVGNEDVLELDIRVHPNPLQHVGDQGLVGVVLQTRVEVR